MSLKLFDTLARFQQFINKVLIEKLDIFVMIRLNNILIYNENLG